jgi:pyridoxal phosphate enzyme (YggS family)
MSSDLQSKSSEDVAANLAITRQKIAAAALRYSRPPGSVNLLAVSKLQSVDRIRMAFESGQKEFGENYLQEALPKIAELADRSLTWHYIGQIQSNKTRAIAESFSWVHTVDRLKIAQRLSEQRPASIGRLNICIQLKLAEEEGKGGVAPADALSLAKAVVALPGIQLRGVMCIPPPRDTFDEQLELFREAERSFSQIRSAGIEVDTLSMGMSGDLDAAIAAGATIVRVGTAIFGERRRDA